MREEERQAGRTRRTEVWGGVGRGRPLDSCVEYAFRGKARGRDEGKGCHSNRRDVQRERFERKGEEHVEETMRGRRNVRGRKERIWKVLGGGYKTDK